MNSQDESNSSTATRIVLSHPADLSKHGRNRIRQEYYKKYLRKTKEQVAVGDLWEDFTDVGCCGSQLDVPLRIEEMTGGTRMGPNTEITFTEREACGLNSRWSVQHDEPDTVNRK